MTPRAKKPRNEGKVVAACLQWLYAHGCLAARFQSGSLPASYKRKDNSIGHYRVRFGRPGWADIIACSPTGRYIEVECKDGIGKQEPQQSFHQKDVVARHGIYILAYSVDDLEARKAEILA